MRGMYDIKGKWCILGKYVDRGSVRHALDMKLMASPVTCVNQKNHCIVHLGHPQSQSPLVGALLCLNCLLSMLHC